MPPNPALTAVELTIPSGEFFDAMSDIGAWLAGRRVTSPYSTCGGTAPATTICASPFRMPAKRLASPPGSAAASPPEATVAR